MKLTFGKIFAAVALVAVASGVKWRFSEQDKAREKAAPSKQPPGIRVVSPTMAPEVISISLPGSLRPREQVTLFARTSGFLREWKADLGDPVKKGQVLARIDAPELGSNLAQAKSRFAQAQASLALVRGQHERTVSLGKTGTLSPQDIDTSALRLAAAENELSTSRSEVERLNTLVSFLTVAAPFDGAITRRMAENGALVSNGVTALFEVASVGDLRIDVEVPQFLAAQVKTGTPAKVTIGKESAVWDAQVDRTSGALDPVLRTLPVQLKFTRGPAVVVPGSYARVKFEVPRSEPALLVPGAAVTNRGGASMLGVVQADSSIKFVPIKLVRDLGREVEFQGEVQPTMKVALYPSPSLSDGDKVTAVEVPKPEGAMRPAGAKP